jgi:hypothetical protein
MATDSDSQPAEDEMLPDEREVLEERGEELEQADDDEVLTVDEVAENLGLDAE